MAKIKIEFGVNFLPEALQIRQAVFIEEQGFQTDIDEHDNQAYHIVIYLNELPVATARAFEEENQVYHIGRVAVLKPFRKTGLGRQLIIELEKYLKTKGAKGFYLGAQVYARQFYEKLGYEQYGDVFLDEGSPHLHMKKSL